MIVRDIIKQITTKINGHKVIILLGPRQVGKTTLLKNHFVNDETLLLNGDDTDILKQLSDSYLYKDLLQLGKTSKNQKN